MRIAAQLLFSALTLTAVAQSSDPTSLWIFRMEQNANEGALYKKLQGNDAGFPTSTALFKRNDTIRYKSGKIFRTCEVENSQLNGSYKVFFPNGQMYMLANYRNNAPVDSTTFYDETGKRLSVVTHLSADTERQTFFDPGGNVKRVDEIKITPTTSSTFKSGYVHTNTEKKRSSTYYDPTGQLIDKQQYEKLYPGEL